MLLGRVRAPAQGPYPAITSLRVVRLDLGMCPKVGARLDDTTFAKKVASRRDEGPGGSLGSLYSGKVCFPWTKKRHHMILHKSLRTLPIGLQFKLSKFFLEKN